MAQSIATIVTGAADLQAQARAAHAENARTISYLEGMPAYLRNDIGLPQDADIRRLVEHGRCIGDGRPRRHRNLAIHAACGISPDSRSTATSAPCASGPGRDRQSGAGTKWPQ